MDAKSPDRTFIVWAALAAMAMAALPYIFGVSLTPATYLFQGNTILAPGDPNVYYSYIEQARHGAILMRDVFTSEPHAATLWQPVWLVLGWLANIFHLSTPAVFALGRVLSMALFVATVWWAVRWLWPDSFHRRAGVLLAIGMSGLGGIFALITHLDFGNLLGLPPDLWVSEMVPILSSWATPHFLLITSGYLFVLVSVERSWQEHAWRRIWLAGAVSLMTLSVHPFHILTWVALWVVLTFWRWIQTKTAPFDYLFRWVVILFMSLPAIVYYLIGLLADPIVQGRALQNVNLTPQWWEVLIGLGGALILAGVGTRRLQRERNRRVLWIAAWALVQLMVIFSPFDSQRRLMQGMIIPFALLATPVVVAMWRSQGTGLAKRTAIIIGLTGLLATSTIITGAKIIGDYSQERRGRDHWEYFLTPEYQALFSFVKTFVPVDRPILASAWDSVLIAGFTGQTVVSGHPVETLDYKEKYATVKNFYYQATQFEQASILRRYRACYILTGPRELAYGSAFKPQAWPDLQVAWTGPTMTLYRVTNCRTGE